MYGLLYICIFLNFYINCWLFENNVNICDYFDVRTSKICVISFYVNYMRFVYRSRAGDRH